MEKFYVYTLSDPRTELVFYVGKGQKLRAWQHMVSIRSGMVGCNKAKEDRLREILALGMDPVVCIVHRFHNEQDAFDTEADMIASLPSLTNIMAGGGRAMTPECAKLRLEARQERIDSAKAKKTEAELRRFIARVSTWQDVTFPGMKNGGQLARDFVRDVKALLSTVDENRAPLTHG